MGTDYIMSVRHKYGIAREEVTSLFPLINTMYKTGVENQNYELFVEAIQRVKLCRISLSNNSITDVVLDANLYLNDDDRERFYKMCKRDCDMLLDTLNLHCKNLADIPIEELRVLRQIYFENEFIGHYRMPTYDINNDEQNIQQEIIKGIYLILEDFKKEIEKLDVHPPIKSIEDCENDEIQLLKAENTDLASLKRLYWFVKDRIASYIPIVNSIGRENHEAFIRDLKTLKFTPIGYLNEDIQKVVLDANLYLTDDERLRFYKICKDEYTYLYNVLNNVKKASIRVSAEELPILKKIFFENKPKEFSRLSDYRLTKEPNIQEQLERIIYTVFTDFENEIEKLNVTVKEKTKLHKINSINIDANTTTTNEEIEWLLVDNKEEFINKNKHLFKGRKGKRAYILVVAMQRLGYFRKENYGEYSNLFRYLKKEFKIEGEDSKSLRDAIKDYKNRGTGYYTEDEINSTMKLFK